MTSLSFLRSISAALACGALFSSWAWGTDPCHPHPEEWMAGAMLEHLSAEDQAIRAPVVASVLEEVPGAAECFLSALASWEFLLESWNEPGLLGCPVTPGEGMVWGGREWAFGMGGALRRDIGGTGFRLDSHSVVSPLLLDLDQNGVPSVDGGSWEPHLGIDLSGPLVAFDLDGDGFPELTEWFDPLDGLLVYPSDPDKVQQGQHGLIWVGPLSGLDLLGTAAGDRDGWQAMGRGIDLNEDAMIDGSELEDLYLWRDADRDARIQEGELEHVSAQGISSISLPRPGDCNGEFTMGRDLEAAWDWWPSFVRVRKEWVQGVPPPPTSLPLQPSPVTDVSHDGEALAVDAEGWIAADALAGAGFDFSSGRMLGLSPGGDWLVLQDRAWDEAAIESGRIRRLWVFPLPLVPGGAVVPRIIPLPLIQILQFVFESENRTIVVGNNGGVLLQVDLASHAVTRLSALGSDAPGFRGGNHALERNGQVYLSGHFYNPGQYAGSDVLARLDLSGLPLLLQQTADLDSTRAAFESAGMLVSECPAGPGIVHALLKSSVTDETFLATRLGGTVTILDSDPAPLGLSASASRVLYFKPGIVPGLVEVRVHDVVTGASYSLGNGDYCYPYLVNDGETAFATTVDWGAATMTLWRTEVAEGKSLAPVFTSPRVGALRVSRDGSSFAFLGPNGLRAGFLDPAHLPARQTTERTLTLRVPTPCRPPIPIEWVVPRAGRVKLMLFAATGQAVVTLVDAHLPAGHRELLWDGTDDRGRPLPTGVYFGALSAAEAKERMRLLLLR